MQITGDLKVGLGWGRSRYYSVAVLDVENWGSWPGVTAANIQGSLKRIDVLGLAAAGIDSAQVGRQPGGDGAILACPGLSPRS